MRNKWFLITGLVLMLGVIGLVGCQPSSNVAGGTTALNLYGQQEGIVVSGQGQVPAAPDVAILSLGVQAQSATVADAQSQASGAMNKMMAALTTDGVASKDIQTQYFNITQLTKYDDKTQQQVVTGYQVTNTVTAKIRDLTKTGSTIDDVAAAGGDLTRINSISFSIDDPTSYNTQARAKAMADAQAKANQMATLAGVTLGKPTYISESSYIPSPAPVLGVSNAASVAQTPISSGEMEVTVNVQVTYAIVK